jgi:recombination protein RecR
MFPPSIQKLIDQFLKFPTVGPRTAARFVSYLMRLPKEKIENLINSLQNLKNRIKFCSFCFNPFEGEDSLCPICQDKSRDKTLLCIIEKEIDLVSIEKTKKYKGIYFILGGVVSALKKTDIEKLRIKELEERFKNPQKFGIEKTQFKEIIIALNPTTEGEATAVLLEKELKKLPQISKITRLGKGLPQGGELEYADEETLGSALEGRK